MNLKQELIFQKDQIGIGKRKQSTARVFLIPGTGNITVNKTPGEKYLQYNDTYLRTVWGPLAELKLENQFDIVAVAKGGGLTGQAQAIQLGVARLLCSMDKKNRPDLKASGFLTRDARIKERKKYGLRKARKASQYSKR